MKFDSRTLQILKNFSTINPSILFRVGDRLSTISLTRTVVARAKLSDTVDKEFAVYDLNRFIGIMHLFNDPDITVHDKHLVVSNHDKSRQVNFTFADPSMVYAAPEKDISLDDCDIEFDLSNEVLQSINKGLSILQLPEIAITGDGMNIYVKAIDVKNPTGDTYSYVVGKTDHNFQVVFKAENMKLLGDNYKVKISKRIFAHFQSQDVEYFIQGETTSRFD